MSLKDLSSSGDRATVLRAGVCIVGAGLAGYAVASKLSALGCRVVVLESGAKNGDGRHSSSLNAVENPLDRYSRAETNRCRGLGGTSRLWGGRMIPISRFETQPRPYLDEQGWPIDIGALDVFEREVETLFSLNSENYDDEPRSRGRTARVPVDDPGVRCRWVKTVNFGKRNLQKRWVELAKGETVDVITNATVTHLEINRETERVEWAEATDLNHRKVRVFATHFVLATGTIEATRLMLWTRALLRQPTFGGPALGHYFQDHLRIEIGEVSPSPNQRRDSLLNYNIEGMTVRTIHFELAEEIRKREIVYGAFAYVQMNLDDSPLLRLKDAGKLLQQGQLEFRTFQQLVRNAIPIGQSLYGVVRRGHLTSPPNVNFRLLACVEQQPVFTNLIALSDGTDRAGVPLARVVWKPSEQDGRAFQTMIGQLAGFWSRAGFDTVAKMTLHMPDPETADITQHARDAAHPSGSTRMGKDKDQSVVSPSLVSHDAPNLSIVSASVFPTAGSANPTFTLMKLAMWHAEYLARSGKV